MNAPLKYAYGRISISSSADVQDYIKGDSAMRDFLAEQMSKATADAMWQTTDDMENSHIGPLHGPGRTECHAAWMHLRNVEALRALGRAAGPYRR